MNSFMPQIYPTPPSPPEDSARSGSLHSTIDLLNSLIDYYEEGQLWVDEVRANLVTSSNVSEQNGRESHESRWVHRKNGFNLRLESLSSKPDTRKENILELFGQLIETRLESCQRAVVCKERVDDISLLT
ncbi:hypothetical protein F5887DRAFT_937019 [Amanita rubescens]|nr:hypothetical protein F5887DRAFT_937019 [Amanita rubescens]